MPLKQLARQIVTLQRQSATTPVLVTPSYLSLQPPFFSALAVELARHQTRTIRLDWYRELFGAMDFVGHCLARQRVARINRRFARAEELSDLDVTLQLTATIGRPSAEVGKILIGISTDELELPVWTTSIRLATTLGVRQGASPDQTFHLQSPQLVSAA